MLTLRRLEQVFVVLSLFFFTDAVVKVVAESIGISISQSNRIARFIVLVSLGINLALVFLWRKRIVRLVLKEKWLLVLIAIALASVLWSYAPRTTLQRLVILLNSTLFGAYFAARYSLKQQLELLGWVFGISVVLSLLFVFVLPSYGVMGMGDVLTPQHIAHMGTWRGIYLHKNILGRTMVLSGIVFFLLAKSLRRYSWITWIGLSFSICLILGSTSKTALVTVLVLFALLPFYKSLRWKYASALRFWIALILVGGSVAALLVMNVQTILGLIGRDLTLTGRTKLWAILFDKIWERPWLGYGYGGFWLGSIGKSGEVEQLLRTGVPHGHNGFLDIWIDLGLLGLSVFLLGFFLACLRAIILASRTKAVASFFPIAYLTFLPLINLSESGLMHQKSFSFWVVYVAVTLSLHKNRPPAKIRRAKYLHSDLSLKS